MDAQEDEAADSGKRQQTKPFPSWPNWSPVPVADVAPEATMAATKATIRTATRKSCRPLASRSLSRASDGLALRSRLPTQCDYVTRNGRVCARGERAQTDPLGPRSMAKRGGGRAGTTTSTGLS